jgi:hypothetical protein
MDYRREKFVVDADVMSSGEALFRVMPQRAGVPAEAPPQHREVAACPEGRQ